MEIAASKCGECEIGIEVYKWLNVGMSEKLSVKSVYVASAPNSSFKVHSLFKDFAKLVHSSVR